MLNFLKDKKVLVVAAHPDDEVLGCGGTIARITNIGAEVHVLIMAEGITSRQVIRDPELVAGELEDLREQAKNVSNILGVRSVKTVGFPDNRMDTIEFLDVIKKIEKEKKRIKPDVVFTHYCGDLNIDHSIVSKAVHTAFRPLPGEKCRMILEWETASSTEWSNSESVFRPVFFVEISRQLDKKIEALKCYNTEFREFPHPRSEEAVKATAKHRGSMCGVKVAEAFYLRRYVDLDDA